MPLVVADRVQQTGTANTTVSFTLSGSVTGFQTFAVIGNTNTTYYAATDNSGSWEVGIGTYSTTGPTLTRTTILSSSNSGSAVTFSGTVAVFVTYPSETSVSDGKTNVIEVNSTDAALRITQTGTGNALLVQDSSPDSSPFVVDASGNVGIGTTTPDTLLHLAGADTAVIRLENTDNSLVADQIIGGLEFEKTDPSGAGAGVVGGLRMYSQDSIGASTYLALSTSNSTAGQNNVERMRIDSAGNVNIATGGALGVGIAADSSITVSVDKTYTTNGTRIGLDLNTSITDSTLTASRSNYGILNVNTVTQSTALGANTLTNYGQYNQVYNGSANDVTSNATTMFGTRSLATNRAAGTVSTLYGAYNQTVNSRSGSTTASMFGAYNNSTVTLGTATTAYGTYNEVQIDGGTLTTAYGTFNFFDHNGGTLTNAIGSFTNFDGTIGKKLGHIVETGSTLDFGTTGDPATANRTVTFGVVPDTSTWVSQRLGSFSTAATNTETALTVGSASTITSELLFDTTNNVATNGYGTGELASIVAINAGSTNIGELKVFVANSEMQVWVSEASANYVLMYSPIRFFNGLSDLNWYEENTWTPVVADASTGGNVSATAAVGAFTRIGNMVTLTFSVTNLSTVGLTAANDLFIRGLPFAAKSLSGTQYFTGAVMLGSTTVVVSPTLSITDNTAYMRIAENIAGAAFDYMVVSEFTSGSADIYGSITYLAA